MSSIQGKTVHGLEEYGAIQIMEHYPETFWVRASFIECYKRQHGSREWLARMLRIPL